MKKLTTIFSIFLFLFLAANTIGATAKSKTFSQGFYTMKDLSLYEGTNHFVKNSAQHGEGLLIILDSTGIIQQVIRVKPDTQYTMVPLLSGYQFIIHGNSKLYFE